MSLAELFPSPPPSASRKKRSTKNKYELNENGQFVLQARPSAFEIFFMCPIFFCMGCCLSTSANVVFDENDRTVTISNWRGYMCFPPCLSSIKIPYSEVGNIGIRNTGGTKGPQGHEQPIYEVVLVTKSAEVWIIGGRGLQRKAQGEADVLYNFLFLRGSDGKPSSVNLSAGGGSVIVPSKTGCCSC